MISLPVKSIFGIGSRGVPSFALPALGSRGVNSNAVPPSLITRNALNPRLFFLEFNFRHRPARRAFLCLARLGFARRKFNRRAASLITRNALNARLFFLEINF